MATGKGRRLSLAPSLFLRLGDAFVSSFCNEERIVLVRSRKLKVLIVDNEIEFASTLAERLRLRKIEVETAFSGQEGLAAVSVFHPDVMILDLRMPDMGGLEVLAQVKTLAPAIEVILLTGHGSFEDGIAGMELGAFDYLVKPIDLVLLMEKITEAYQKKSQRK